jgi:acyl carrier protein
MTPTARAMTIAEFLADLRRRDVRCWADGNVLRCIGPRGMLTPELQAELARRKAEILSHWRTAAAVGAAPTPPLEPRPRNKALPLSFAQERLWLLQQSEPGGTAYNFQSRLPLVGKVTVATLERALSEVIQRHETLRTTFGVVQGLPVQLIAPASPLALPVADLRALSESEREGEAQRVRTIERLRTFDLERGPLFSLFLLQWTDEAHELVFTYHKIVTDDASIALLHAEIRTLYDAFEAGLPSPLSELRIQYADFAYAQRQWLRGDVLERSLSYWRKQLAEPLPLPSLPTDGPEPARATGARAVRPFALPKAVSEGIKLVARTEGTTLFMALLAAFKVLLFRSSAQTDVVVGTRSAIRTWTETERIIGPFLNTLVLRTDLSGDPTFRELLGRVKDVALGAYAHSEVPFQRLVEEFGLPEDLSGVPFLRVARQPPLPATTPVTEGSGGDQGLTFSVVETGVTPQGIRGYVEYRADLFDASTIDRLVGDFEALLEGIVADPGRRICDPQILGAHPSQGPASVGKETALNPPSADASAGRLSSGELAEIEAALREHGAIQSVELFTKEGTADGGQLVAYLVYKPGPQPTVTELREYLKGKLPRQRTPSSFVVLDAFPTTPEGAIDRQALAGVGGGTEKTGSLVGPLTPMETLVAQVWQDALGLERVGVHDNFFDLGGHSLLLMRVIARIEKETGLRIDPREIMFQTLEQFAAMCERTGARTQEGRTRQGSPP